MNEPHKYRATDKMSDLICDNYSLLMVMSRFGLSLGFGDKSVKDVCEALGKARRNAGIFCPDGRKTEQFWS